MNNYEVLYVLDNSTDDAIKESIIAKFSDIVTSDGGTVESVSKWGTKRLAYPINYKTEGYYVLMNFQAKPAIPAELERVMLITDQVLRHMIIAKQVKS